MMMLVTDIVKKDNKKKIIYINYEKAFVLYNREVKRFSIEKDEEMPDFVYEEIMNDILPKRCMERALYMLQASDKSKEDIRNKLLQGGYPEKIVSNIMERLEEYGYIDDYRYSSNYIRYNIKSKSRSRILFDLSSKGIKKEVVENAFDSISEEYDIDNLQKEIIKKEFDKKRFDFTVNDKNLLNKVVVSLMRKGFKYDDIMQAYYEQLRS